MRTTLSGAFVYRKDGFYPCDVTVDDGRIVSISRHVPVSDSLFADSSVVDMAGLFLFPGFVDVHVHLREPGFSYKETVATGTAAAARGGVTSLCTMPNLDPPPDNAEHLALQQAIIDRDAVVHVYPMGTLTAGRMGKSVAPLAEMTGAIAFSDDGSGVQTDDVMRQAMTEAKRLGKIVAAHCEVNALLNGGYIHDGDYAAAHGHRGICSESEWGQIKRDLDLVRETGVAYHVCHISTAESVAIIREARAKGVKVTCETAPHYLTMCDGDLQEEGRFKMNPPLRSKADREALVEGILDGTIECIATDHAPHTAEEKSKGLRGSAMGIVGLETAFGVMYTHFVRTGKISLARLFELMCENPRRIFRLGGGMREREKANIAIFDLDTEYTVNPDEFLSMGKATPFEGWKLYGRCVHTLYRGETVWQQ